METTFRSKGTLTSSTPRLSERIIILTLEHFTDGFDSLDSSSHLGMYQSRVALPPKEKNKEANKHKHNLFGCHPAASNRHQTSIHHPKKASLFGPNYGQTKNGHRASKKRPPVLASDVTQTLPVHQRLRLPVWGGRGAPGSGKRKPRDTAARRVKRYRRNMTNYSSDSLYIYIYLFIKCTGELGQCLRERLGGQPKDPPNFG